MSATNSRDVCIVGIARTPVGCFGGALKDVCATDLGAIAIEGALRSANNLSTEHVGEVFMGNVMSGNLGQAPAKAMALKAGIPTSVPCTLVNKVCASGMKAISLGAMTLQTGMADCVVAGGAESMSRVPYYYPDSVEMRFGTGGGKNGGKAGSKFGHRKIETTVVDGLQKDGLSDSRSDQAMGVYGDLSAAKYSITREEQDEFALRSYQRAQRAMKEGKLANEICEVTVGATGQIVSQDEEPNARAVNKESFAKLKPAFNKNGGTVTAGNASKINDGGAAVVLVTREFARKHGLQILAVIRSFADASVEPQDFAAAPSFAMQTALKRAAVDKGDVDVIEINEAFAAVPLINAKIVGLPLERVNLHGSGCSIGHPLGCSGARIVVSAVNLLHTENKSLGLLGICNGGGGASAMVIEREDQDQKARL